MEGVAASCRHRVWPRSSSRDLEEALGIAAEAGAAWAKRSRGRRSSALADCALPRGVRARADAEIESAFGLRPDERPADELRARPYFPRALLAQEEEDEPQRHGPGVALVVAHPCELVAGPALRALRHLVAGRPVVLLADAAFPWAGELFAHAVHSAGLPPGVAAVLHGDARALAGSCLPTLARDPRGVAFVDVADFSAELVEAQRRLGNGPPGLWRVLRNRSRVVKRSADVGAAAGAVLRNAFGRSSTLFAQVPGQVARVLCHERRFSAFTEALLERVANADELFGQPVPRLLADGVAHARRARSLGLDEGATPILDRSDANSGSEGPRSRRLVGPVIFTNVEPGQRLARETRPAPVLALIRAVSDDQARQTAARLDRVELPPSSHSKGTP